MLREVLRGRSNLSARERVQYPDLNRKDTLRLLSSNKQDLTFDYDEVMTEESIKVYMDIFWNVKT